MAMNASGFLLKLIGKDRNLIFERFIFGKKINTWDWFAARRLYISTSFARSWRPRDIYAPDQGVALL